MKTIQITLFIIFLSITSCAQKSNDKIVGVWDVKTKYYQAIYEIVEDKGKFFGKVHYYNDGQSEYKGKNKKEDYFLTDVEAKNGKYINGKIYLPNGSFYNVTFKLKDENTLEALMTVEGKPYKETWKRNLEYSR